MTKNAKKLARLDRKSGKALSLIERLIARLHRIAEENNAIIDRIARRRAELDEEAAVAERQKAHASALASNFEKLITVGE